MAYLKKFKAFKPGTKELIEVEADYYMVAEALEHSPIMAHSQKKLWDCGNRNGGKSYLQDVAEIRNQCNMELDRNGWVDSERVIEGVVTPEQNVADSNEHKIFSHKDLVDSIENRTAPTAKFLEGLLNRIKDSKTNGASAEDALTWAVNDLAWAIRELKA